MTGNPEPRGGRVVGMTFRATLLVAMTAGLVACGGDGNGSGNRTGSDSQATGTGENTAPTAASRTLMVNA